MNNSIFGELVFNTGWKAKTDISLFGNTYAITIKAKAYFETDGITAEQERAFGDFSGNKVARLQTAENLLNEYAGNNAAERFTPRTLLFQRDGGYALLLDDKDDEDDGVAVCLAPKPEVVSQDVYL
ncbi:MAG: hypothetical protein LBN30_10985 [Oscillospiraceae bacterium]|jgi:hypothetical protein|nr:hypothetical protein [Oscillospiraceae bacterium]